MIVFFERLRGGLRLRPSAARYGRCAWGMKTENDIGRRGSLRGVNRRSYRGSYRGCCLEEFSGRGPGPDQDLELRLNLGEYPQRPGGFLP